MISRMLKARWLIAGVASFTAACGFVGLLVASSTSSLVGAGTAGLVWTGWLTWVCASADERLRP